VYIICGTLREERRLRVFENRVLREIFGSKRDQVTGERRRIYNEQLYEPYISLNIMSFNSRKMRWKGHIARVEESQGAYRVLVGKSEGKETTWKAQA
jgi:hypothetical protein